MLLERKGWASLSARPEFRPPHAQGAVLRSEFEVVVGAQERQIVPNAQLSKHRVNSADLDACSAANVPEVGGCDMVFAIGLHQRKRCEALNDLCAGLRSRESLKEFLENQTGRDDNIGAQKGVLQ